VGLARELLNEYKMKVSAIELLPSSGGVFEVTLDGALIFSKRATDRFPEYEEIRAQLK
jgi:selenoprotein W-related protein